MPWLRLIICQLTVLSVVLPLVVQAAGDDPDSDTADTAACVTHFTEADPRLFEFIETRREVDYGLYAGRRIREIRYITLPIFNPDDPREDKSLYHAANWLHILTKSSPIRRQMLVQPDDVLDAERIHETERILRGAGYLYDAMILPARVCPDSIDLLVVVRDVWTLQPVASFSRTGGENSTSFGIAERNILGYGHSLSLSYKADDERSGVGIGFNSDHLWDGHTSLQMEYQDNSDGTAERFAVDRPFYTVDTPWSAGFVYQTYSLEQEITTGDITSNEYDEAVENIGVHIGILTRLQGNVAHRWRTGLARQTSNYGNQSPEYTQPMPDDRVLAYPWVEFESTEYDYWTTSNLYQLFRNEDINLGTRYSVRLGVTNQEMGSTENAMIANVQWQKTSSFGTHHVMQNHAYANLYRNKDIGEYEHSTWGYVATYEHFIDDYNRWHALLQYNGGNNLDLQEMFTVGGGAVLRGYEKDTQRGDRYAVAIAEYRHFHDIHPLNLFRLGSAIFVEAGRAWESRPTIEQSDAVLYDVGFGLRINSSKARPDHIFHINIAFPLNKDESDDKYLVSFFAGTSM